MWQFLCAKDDWNYNRLNVTVQRRWNFTVTIRDSTCNKVTGRDNLEATNSLSWYSNGIPVTNKSVRVSHRRTTTSFPCLETSSDQLWERKRQSRSLIRSSSRRSLIYLSSPSYSMFGKVVLVARSLSKKKPIRYRQLILRFWEKFKSQATAAEREGHV